MKEALKLALEALEVYGGKAEHRRTKEDESKAVEAITALRLAIDVQNMASESTYKAALAQPPQRIWVGLTDEERKEVWWSCEQHTPTTFAKAIETKLKEKNNE